MKEGSPVVVAIPVKDEEEFIGRSLAALCGQSVRADAILLFLNNCADRTAAICRDFAGPMKLVVIEETLTGKQASAGEARRRALTHAEQHFPAAVILTTDADGEPPPDWVERNLQALREGAEVVCGRAELFAQDAARIRGALQSDNEREVFLLSLLDEMDALIDPNPSDPWPRHTSDSGASIALRPGVLQRIGGAPPVASGEDRALIDRCRIIDLRIRHDPGIMVPVSGRLEGRAPGGMAETIKRRTRQQDALTDAKIEPAADAYRRSLTKAQLRACWQGRAAVNRLADLGLEAGFIASLLQAPFFGAAWDALETRCRLLQRRRVAYSDLADETDQALQLRQSLEHNATQ